MVCQYSFDIKGSKVSTATPKSCDYWSHIGRGTIVVGKQAEEACFCCFVWSLEAVGRQGVLS